MRKRLHHDLMLKTREPDTLSSVCLAFDGNRMAGMSRLKVVLITGTTMLIAVVLLSLVIRSIVLAGFARLEHDAGVANVERAGSALVEKGAVLGRIARDWAGWDDTYDFAATVSPDYVDANLQPDSFANLGVRYMIFLDPERKVIAMAGADLETGERLPPNQAIVDAVVRTDRLFDLPKLDSSRSGIITAPDGLFMAGAAPITDSSITKRARGTLVVLAPLDAAAVEALGQQTKLDLSLVSIAEADQLEQVNERLGADETRSGAALVGLGDTEMVGLWPVEDLRGEAGKAFAVRMRRETWAQGLAVGRWLTVTIGVFGLLAVVAAVALFDRRLLATSRNELEAAVGQRTQELSSSEARFRGLVDQMAQGLLALDSEGRITFANRAAEDLLGVDQASLVGTMGAHLFAEDGLEHRFDGLGQQEAFVDASICRDGVLVPVQITATEVDESGAGQWLIRDVTMQRRYEQQLVHLASHDHLTGLANRRRFEEELEREIRRAARTGRGGGVLWLDLDNFKEVNDSLGHRAGDELLVAVADFLLSNTRAHSLVARIGGDEFALLVLEASLMEVERTAHRLLEDMSRQRFDISGHRIAVTASAGAVIYPDHGATVEELLSRADIAMYTAKERRSGGHAIWSADDVGDASSRTRLEWSERIRHAIDNDTVVVFAQPIARSATGEVESHELLMRLPGDEPGHVIAPGDFLPAAERLGLIRDLDRWMVLNAIRLVAEWPSLGMLHVNLSGHAFADTELLGLIEAGFARTGAKPSLLGFEITETAAIADIQSARELIAGLRRLGCGLSLDDFGSGFSSFYYLRNLPIDCLKIDGAFVTQLRTHEEDRHLVRAIVELAKALGLNTVAEYVEDEETLAIVRDMGVTFAQGYHVGRPVPFDSLIADTTAC